MSESDDRDLDAVGQPPPAWAHPGTVVRYRPHVGHDPWYLGEIAGEPRLLGGTWVVRLGRMEAAYHLGRGGAAAAAIDALEPVMGPASWVLDDNEELTVTDEWGDSVTLTRAQWRWVVTQPEGHISGGLRWRHMADGRIVAVRRVVGGFPVYVDGPAVRRWVEAVVRSDCRGRPSE